MTAPARSESINIIFDARTKGNIKIVTMRPHPVLLFLSTVGLSYLVQAGVCMFLVGIKVIVMCTRDNSHIDFE